MPVEDTPTNQPENKSRSHRETREHEAAKQRKVAGGNNFQAEMIYTSDLETVLSMMSRAIKTPTEAKNYKFFHACLDRLDLLITERHSVVDKK